MPNTKSVTKTIGLSLLVCGTLDITDAFVFYGLHNHVAPQRILLNIASNLLGKSAFQGGIAIILLGLLLHYFIAFCWITAYDLTAQKVRLLLRFPVVFGVLYGFLIYFVMNYLVLPHTANPSHPSAHPNAVALTNAIAALVVFMGICVALMNRRFAPPPSA